MTETALQTRPDQVELTDDELLAVLGSSLYPGAKTESIRMVIAYCRAAKLDPIQKPVHIVPMSVKIAGQRRNNQDVYEYRDVVMPGIGLYRIQAARTGQHAGTDAPVFGPMVEFTVGDVTTVHPEWCSVTVYRMKRGEKCAFTAVEYWEENYATAGRDTFLPNTMWRKRARGQIAKCAEAQALRKGFPEVGSQPTAEEMEGKTFYDEVQQHPAEHAGKPAVAMPQALENSPGETLDLSGVQIGRDFVPAERAAQPPAAPPPASPPSGTMVIATDGERAYIKGKLAKASGQVREDALRAGGIDGDFDTIEAMTKDQFVAMRDVLKKS